MEGICTIVAIKKVKQENDYLVEKIRSEHKCYCKVSKAWMDEFYKGQAEGIRPTLKLKIRLYDFYLGVEDETDVSYIIYNGKKYDIIRTFFTENDEFIEITCKDK